MNIRTKLHRWLGQNFPLGALGAIALLITGCGPEECFYTDDIAEYVAAAKNEGMDAVRFVSCEQLEHELRSRGVAW